MTDQLSILQSYDRYIAELFAPEDRALEAAREESQRKGMPGINVSASEGKLLHLLARVIDARRILEIGTLGGYSTIWLARALPPEGKLITLEIDSDHAAVARQNLKRAGLLQKVQIKVGPALDSLLEMHANREPEFDLVFIDADKEGYPIYLEKSLPLLRERGLVVADNTLPNAVLDPRVRHGAKRYNTEVSARADLTSILVPVLRSKGIDGLSISLKESKVSAPSSAAPP
jgi:predicted O-methyltransferase YrrM